MTRRAEIASFTSFCLLNFIAADILLSQMANIFVKNNGCQDQNTIS